jgi:hypothetical protein
MIENDAVEMFGTPVLRLTPDGSALEASLNNCAEKAADIHAHLGRGVVDPGIDQITSSVSELAQALGAARSAQDMGSRARALQDKVMQNTQALGDRAAEAESKATDLVAKFGQAVDSWGNVHDTATLKKAVGDTASAGKALGEALVVLGAAVAVCDPPWGSRSALQGLLCESSRQ